MNKNIQKIALAVVAIASIQSQPAYGMSKVKGWLGLNSKTKQNQSWYSKTVTTVTDLAFGKDGDDRPNPNCLLKFLPAADALMKLYFYHNADKYSELATGAIKQEAQAALAGFGQTPNQYEIKLISTPGLNNVYSFKKKDVNGKFVIYLDKLGLTGKDQEQLKSIVKDKVEDALYRPFITYETIKAVTPFIVHIIGNSIIDSAWYADMDPSALDNVLDSSTIQFLVSVAIVYGINYSKAYRLQKFIPKKS